MTPTPRLLVAMPKRGCPYAPSLLRANDLARRFGGELLLEIGRPIELVRTRIMSRFLESGADRILTIDDDVVAPDDAVDLLLALAAAVATAPYPIALDGRLVADVKLVGSEECRPAADRRRIGDDRQRHVRLGERRGARHPRRVPVEPRRPDDRLLC